MRRRTNPDADLPRRTAEADHFVVSVFIGRGVYDKVALPTLSDARQQAAAMNATHPTKRAMIYAVSQDGRSTFIPPDYQPEKETPMHEDLTKAPAKKKAAPKKAPAKKAAKATGKVRGSHKAALEAAQKGKLPTPPDFSADTHKPHRAKLDEVVKLAKAGDVKGLKAVPINLYSSSPKAIDRYRNLCVIALEARKGA